MFVVRSSSLSLLLLLLSSISGLVAVATARQSPACPQVIPAALIRDLWNQTSALINKLPKEENSSRRKRLLPKFCTRCPTHAIGWLEVREVIDMYQRSVFSRDFIQKLLPLHYEDLLFRLQFTLQHCVSSVKPSKWFKLIKKLERKMKKRRHESALKAVGEFTYVLRWIDELANI
ncbi:hypothetical protein JOB18_028089 [Solea senegalensis]|uniref:Interleukin-26 n=1 Tax=Solea senegalensis TaxID=28829 RepID=A0AAV6QUB2_SOLSE|nr:hypothetical protein JOB18_020614 [Solea senegalensis]KAG7466717.1 hypothetical protein JOB18_020614 [Solea senegalensis]KAG7496934.1 hypothetical protein JOB18_028089 [Solea senegalensis]